MPRPPLRDDGHQTDEFSSFNIRPAIEIRPEFRRIAGELGHTEGKFAVECITAVVRMIIEREPMLPNLVRMARALRKSGETMLDAPSPFPVKKPRKKRL